MPSSASLDHDCRLVADAEPPLARFEPTPTSPLDDTEQPRRRPAAAGARHLVFVPCTSLADAIVDDRVRGRPCDRGESGRGASVRWRAPERVDSAAGRSEACVFASRAGEGLTAAVWKLPLRPTNANTAPSNEFGLLFSVLRGAPATIVLPWIASEFPRPPTGCRSEPVSSADESSHFNSSASTSPGGGRVRYIFRQTYFREALQHLIDQPGWITAFLQSTARVACGPIPLAPPSPFVSASAVSATPCSFSVSAARQLLTANGWNVVRGGTTTCLEAGDGSRPVRRWYQAR